MNKRQTSAQETRRKLVATALEMLREKGFDAVNVEDITKRAGVAKGTFYTYFRRKEDIVLEISRAPFNEISEELSRMEDSDITEKLAHYFRRFMECVESCGIHVCRQWVRDVLDPSSVPDDKDGQKFFYDLDMLESFLKKSVDCGELKEGTPVDTLARVILCELYGMMTCWCMSDGKFEPLEWTGRFCEVQLCTLLAPYMK